MKMHFLKKALPAVFVVGITYSSVAAADSQHHLFVGARIARFFTSAAMAPEVDNFNMWGGSVGQQLYGRWAYELSYLRGKSEFDYIGGNVTSELLQLDAYHVFPERRGAYPLMLIGGGKQRFSYQEQDFDNDMVNLGAGLIFPLDGNLRFRAELRAIYDLERDVTSYSLNASWLISSYL